MRKLISIFSFFFFSQRRQEMICETKIHTHAEKAITTTINPNNVQLPRPLVMSSTSFCATSLMLQTTLIKTFDGINKCFLRKKLVTLLVNKLNLKNNTHARLPGFWSMFCFFGTYALLTRLGLVLLTLNETLTLVTLLMHQSILQRCQS